MQKWNALYQGESIEANKGLEDHPDPPNRGNRCLIHPPHRLPRPAARDDKGGHQRLIHSDVAIPRDSTRALGPIRCRLILINPELEDPGVSNCRRKGHREQRARREITPESRTSHTELLWRLWTIGEATSPNATFFRTVSILEYLNFCRRVLNILRFWK